LSGLGAELGLDASNVPSASTSIASRYVDASALLCHDIPEFASGLLFDSSVLKIVSGFKAPISSGQSDGKSLPVDISCISLSL
jgi:hypothetical protein